MIIAAGLSPAWQQIISLDRLRIGEVNRATSVQWCASGKVLNVGIALHSLGTESITLAPVGGTPGTAIIDEFKLLGAPAHWIRTRHATRVCTTVLDAASGSTTELVENAGPLLSEEWDDFQSAFLSLRGRARLAVFTGSLPRGIPQRGLSELIRSLDCPLVLDIRGTELLSAVEFRPLVVKPNREELEQTVARPIKTESEIIDAAQELLRLGAQHAVITQGKLPTIICSPAATYRVHPIELGPTVNPIGCGDCLAAGIAAGISRGMPILDAVRMGTLAAAQNATAVLPARLNPAEIEARIGEVRAEKIR